MIEGKPFIQEGVIKKIWKGYVFVQCGNKWMQEHRLVVENNINRLLKKGETIHHLDGNRMNNDINNLMLFPTQKEHKSFENKVKQFGFTKPIQREIKNRWENFK